MTVREKLQTRIHVLVIDDEDDMCWALRQIVEAEGHSCVLANTASAALQAVGMKTFHLAFVDVKLPDMNGFDLVRCLHCLAPRLPCVLVSGFLYDDDDLVRDSLASGLIAGFIGKPFLLTQIQEVLNTFAAATGRVADVGSEAVGGKAIPSGGIGGALNAEGASFVEPPPGSLRSPKVMA